MPFNLSFEFIYSTNCVISSLLCCTKVWAWPGKIVQIRFSAIVSFIEWRRTKEIGEINQTKMFVIVERFERFSKRKLVVLLSELCINGYFCCILFFCSFMYEGFVFELD